MKTNPNSIAAAKANAKRFWTDPILRAKNIEGRKSERFQETHPGNFQDAEFQEKATQAKRASEKFKEHCKVNIQNCHTPEARKKAAESFKTSEAAQAALRNAREKMLNTPHCQPGEGYHAAKMWYFRSPDNVTFTFRCLPEFVRNHMHFFQRDGDTVKRVTGGLSNLRPTATKKRTPGSWRGWTWVSYTEEFTNDGNDLLGRVSDGL